MKTWKIQALFYPLFFIYSLSLFAQVGSVTDSENPFLNESSFVDTLPFLQCKVIINHEQKIDHYIGTRAGITESFTVFFIDCPEGKDIFGEITINDESITFDDPQSTLNGITIRPNQNHLHLFFNDTIEPLLDFMVRNDSLVFSPKFVSKLEFSYDFRSDTLSKFENLYYILSNMSFTDKHPVRVLELINSRKLMAIGEWDLAETTLTSLAKKASADSDNYVIIRCKKLLKKITHYKKATVPFDLVDARKIERLSDTPIYPPGDNPSVFWQDTLLCVIQTDPSNKVEKMRSYDPVRKQWGKVLPTKNPDYSIECFYHVYTCYYCNDLMRYWHTSLALPGEEGSCDLCDCFTDTRPLVSIPSDSTFIFKGGYDSLAIARSGGSCIAGKGRYFFDEDNTLSFCDSKISWNILPEGIISWGADIVEDYIYSYYPVVVSPNQKWVAYAVKLKDEEKIELWVAKLNYHNNYISR